MTDHKNHRQGGTHALASDGEHSQPHDHGHHGHHGHGHGPHGGHGHGPHGGRGRGGPEGRRKRVFGGAELSLVLLHLIEPEPRHGYDLIRELDSRTGGAYAPSPGIVYPTIAAMEEAGLLEAIASDGAKRMFGITESGRSHLAEQQEAVAKALAKLDAVRASASQLDTGPVSRAMQNLGVVLDQRLAATQEKQALFDIADLLDEVARKIERMV
ncbi:MAG: PadR family transcriptional regulator [Pseudomonadota bacterium]|nr:PadR family transcriptional regulator [Pseudomonadota bacterium]